MGKSCITQAWLLLASSLTDYVPHSAAARSHPQNRPSLSHSVSGHAGSSGYIFPASGSQLSDSATSLLQRSSPGRRGSQGPETSIKIPQRRSTASTPHGLTPTSSNSSSPRHVPGALPPITPRRPSVFGHRESIDSGLAKYGTLYRRPSLAHSAHSSSPSNRSNPSLRHVGEGALDDSDSSSDSEHEEAEEIGDASSDEEVGLRALTSPYLAPLRNLPTPSPLSQVAGQQQWTEDEGAGDRDDDDEASPSPGSTDTESSGSVSSRIQMRSGKSSRRNSNRMKSRSRSSTVASLAAPKFSRPLAHQESFSSIRTVTAGEVSFREQEGTVASKGDESIREGGGNHHRQKSQALSDLSLGLGGGRGHGDGAHHEAGTAEAADVTERRIEVVCSEEERMRELGWETLRATFEEFADAVNGFLYFTLRCS